MSVKINGLEVWQGIPFNVTYEEMMEEVEEVHQRAIALGFIKPELVTQDRVQSSLQDSMEETSERVNTPQQESKDNE